MAAATERFLAHGFANASLDEIVCDEGGPRPRKPSMNWSACSTYQVARLFVGNLHSLPPWCLTG